MPVVVLGQRTPGVTRGPPLHGVLQDALRMVYGAKVVNHNCIALVNILRHSQGLPMSPDIWSMICTHTHLPLRDVLFGVSLTPWIMGSILPRFFICGCLLSCAWVLPRDCLWHGQWSHGYPLPIQSHRSWEGFAQLPPNKGFSRAKLLEYDSCWLINVNQFSVGQASPSKHHQPSATEQCAYVHQPWTPQLRCSLERSVERRPPLASFRLSIPWWIVGMIGGILEVDQKLCTLQVQHLRMKTQDISATKLRTRSPNLKMRLVPTPLPAA